MTNYLINIYSPAGDPPPPEVLQPIMTKLAELRAEMQQAGAWVFSSGLDAPPASTVLHVADGAVMETDGPYTEGKEHIGGLTIIKADSREEALAWTRRMAAIITLPLELRPMQDVPS
jgi:hypothetical protein